MIYILCPHVDDEIIGCWTYMQGPHDIRVMYTEPMSPVRKMEADKAASELFHSWQMVQGPRGAIAAVEEEYGENGDLFVLAPDPHWEWHPAHKALGAAAADYCIKQKIRFGTYSTNMNVPYLQELPSKEQDLKKQWMDTCFPSQKDLWKYDYRYFLFEGICEWGITCGNG